MKTVFTFVLVTFFANGLMAAETSAEVVCRAKAKEIAIQTYSSCVTEARQAKVEEIRTGYQKDLAALKSKYDKELKKLANKNTKKEALAVPVTAKELQVQAASKPVKGVAKQLPTKAASPTEVAPVQSVSEGTKVVAVGTEAAESPVDADLAKETAAHDGDQIDYIEMPAE